MLHNLLQGLRRHLCQGLSGREVVGWASAPPEAWPEGGEERRRIRAAFVEPHGDRRQELVFVGTELDPAALANSSLPELKAKFATR